MKPPRSHRPGGNLPSLNPPCIQTNRIHSRSDPSDGSVTFGTRSRHATAERGNQVLTEGVRRHTHSVGRGAGGGSVVQRRTTSNRTTSNGTVQIGILESSQKHRATSDESSERHRKREHRRRFLSRSSAQRGLQPPKKHRLFFRPLLSLAGTPKTLARRFPPQTQHPARDACGSTSGGRPAPRTGKASGGTGEAKRIGRPWVDVRGVEREGSVWSVCRSK